MSKAVLPKPPAGRPPTMKAGPQKVYDYLVAKALAHGLDAEMVVVPGANGAPSDAALFYPGGLTPAQTAYMLSGGNSSVMSNFAAEPKGPKKDETDDEIIDKISNRFNTLQKLSHGVCKGDVRSLIVSGAGGVGKTYTVEQMVEHYKEKANIKSEIRSGIITPIHLYMLLWRNKAKGAVTVLDDADTVFWNDDSVSLLKAALDTSFVRRLSWLSNSSVLKNEGIDNEFIYEGSMIFITNINFQQYLDEGKAKIVPHLQALMTRSMYLDLKLHSQRELVLWIHHMVKKNHILKQDDLTAEQEDDVLDFMFTNQGNLRSLSIRTALQLAQCVKMEPDTWRDLAKDVVLKE